jgi:MFS family permease
MIARRRVFFGWHVVATAFAIAVFAWGLGFYGPSVFLRTLHAERGWSIAVVSAAISAHFVLSAGLVAYLPDAHQRFGIVVTTRVGAAALACGTLAWALAYQPWQLFGAAIISGAGWAATSGAAINAIIVPWFERKRAVALAMAYNGASVGGVLFVPLWVTLIAAVGFRAAVAIVAAVTLTALLPLAERFLRPTPSSLGLAPDGREGLPAARKGEPLPIEPLSRAALLHDRRFLTMSAAFALGLFAQVGLIAHLLALLSPMLGAASASAVVSLATACAVVGRTLLAWMLGSRNRRSAAAANFIMQACGVALLALPGATPALLILGCVLFGLGIGNLVSLPPLIAQVEFRHVDVPRVVALTIAINQSVFAFAPGVFGALHDATDGYGAALVLAAIIQVVSAVLVAVGGRVRAVSSAERVEPI